MYQGIMGRVKAPNLSETIRNELIRLITSGVLKPGTRLNEVHLAESLGVSRGPVREAARELEGLGLTTSRPRQGFYVTDYTDTEIIEIYELSPWIHQALIHDFIAYSDAETCTQILRDIDTIRCDTVAEFSESLLQFRQRMLAHVHNRYLAEHALGLFRRFFIVAALVRADDVEGRIARIINTSRALWQALAQRDEAEAIRIMQEDSAYWLRDVPPRFPHNSEIPSRSNRDSDEGPRT